MKRAYVSTPVEAAHQARAKAKKRRRTVYMHQQNGQYFTSYQGEEPEAEYVGYIASPDVNRDNK